MQRCFRCSSITLRATRPTLFITVIYGIVLSAGRSHAPIAITYRPARRRIIARSAESVRVTTCAAAADTHTTRYHFFSALARRQLTKSGIWHTSAVSQPPNLYYVISLDVTVAGGAACANRVKLRPVAHNVDAHKPSGFHASHSHTVSHQVLRQTVV